MGRGDTLLNAAVGAAVTVVLSFTGVSPLLGGGVAGYLQRESRTSGATAGALSGALAFVPALLFVVLGLGALLAGPMRTMGGGIGLPGGAELLAVLLVLLPLLLVWHVGLGAIGGYLGAYLREEVGSVDGD